MSVQEGMRTYLSDRLILRTCLYLAAVLGVALLVVWPRDPLMFALRTGLAPEAFSIVATCFLLLMIFVEARFGAQDLSADPAVQLPERVRFTSDPLGRLVGGRAAFAFLHTLLLLLLGAPFLAAAVAVGGAGPTRLFRAFAILGAAGVAMRALGLLFQCVLGARRPMREIIMYPVLIALQIAAFAAAPVLSPFHALNAGDPPEWLPCVLANLALAAVFCGFSILALWAVRARARRDTNG
jgi:hypothetical protein